MIRKKDDDKSIEDKNREKKNRKHRKFNFKFKKKNFSEKYRFSILELCVFGFVCLFFGIVCGYLLTYGRNTYTGKKISSELAEVIDTYQTIVDNYYGDLNEEKLAEGAISGMMSEINDPYSYYMDESTTNDFNQDVKGSYVGIGAVVSYADGSNKIIEIIEDSPSEKAGLKVGDIITKVDGTDVSNIFGDDLSNMIKGEKNTSVDLSINRDGEEMDFTLTRKNVEIKSVYSSIMTVNDKNIGVITISTFSSNTYKQFKNNLNKLEENNIDSLIIDVRDNPGGELSQAKQILELFFKKNTVLFKLKDKNTTTTIKASDKDSRNYPVAILVNNSSASASEILASCFDDNYENGYIVGETTYGKGTVQKTMKLSNGTTVKYTAEKWLTSKGKWLNNKGLTPKYIVEQSEEYTSNPTTDNDTQLQKAIELLTK